MALLRKFKKLVCAELTLNSLVKKVSILAIIYLLILATLMLFEHAKKHNYTSDPDPMLVLSQDEKDLVEALGPGFDTKKIREVVERYRFIKKRDESFLIDQTEEAANLIKTDTPIQPDSQPVTTIRSYDDSGCIDMKIERRQDIKSSKTACVPHRASKEACDFANKLYFQDNNLKSCKGEATAVEICLVLETRQSLGAKFNFKCSMNDCLKQDRKYVTVSGTDAKSRKVVQFSSYTDAASLQKDLPDIATNSSRSGYNYLFLECTIDGTKMKQPGVIGQFLLLPPIDLNSIAKTKKTFGLVKPKININIVWMDSVSRAHFYRSLPTVINSFSAINQNKDNDAEVLDFELFQAVEGHTAENAHALLTGEMFPKHWTSKEREAAAVGYGHLLEKFTKRGYSTFYQDDLCYDEWWGMRLDLGSPSTWEELEEKLKENHIHNTGTSPPHGISRRELFSVYEKVLLKNRFPQIH